MSTEAKNQKLTITLTGRAPVTIDKEAWPFIATSGDKEFDNQYEFQANRISKWDLDVRQHADGRAIVYARYSYRSQFQGARDHSVRGGELLPDSSDLPEAIRRVGEWMASQEHQDEDAKRWESLINECIADLPAVELE
jgi:hypothetical protein